MARQITRIDALFVEGTDDRAVVNAFVKKLTGIDLATCHLVKTKEDGGGDSWALRAFDQYIRERNEGARVGVIVDRDGVDNDKWPSVRSRLLSLGGANDRPIATGEIVGGRYGIWMWPDNISHGDLENFVAGIVPGSALMTYLTEVCGIAKETHGAEYDRADSRKAALKVRSVWRDASAAGGYGHLVRNLALTEAPASTAFLAWFKALFLS